MALGECHRSAIRLHADHTNSFATGIVDRGPDSVWLVTGAAGGFGRDLTESALRSGRRVVAAAKFFDDLWPTVRAHTDKIVPIEMDVTNESAAREIVERVVASFGRIDVVVNNAGYEGRLGSSTAELSQRVQTNLFSALWVSEFARAHMIETGGGLIMLAFPFAGDEPGIDPRFLDRTRRALEGFSECLACDGADYDIDVTICLPHDRQGRRSDLGDAPSCAAARFETTRVVCLCTS
jgi:NAD(P)-dependent dehydrogenase (short-subunit alcohol dehydrogenase family)